mmetsp:Transcript_30914/g.99283  ORF Transcript_30914/g.99283 Transcript_30914/m.99283 type:complete len:313 (-) Transcript_30914:32-970(-)
MNYRRSERDKDKEFRKRQKAETELKAAKQENKVLNKRMETVNQEIESLQYQNNRMEQSLKQANMELQKYRELEKDLEKMTRAYKDEKFAKEKETRKRLALSQEISNLESTVKENIQEIESLKRELEEARQKALAGTYAIRGVELEIEKRISESRSLNVMKEIREYLMRRLTELELPSDSSYQTSSPIINIFEGQQEGFVEDIKKNRKQLHKAIIELEISNVTRQVCSQGSSTADIQSQSSIDVEEHEIKGSSPQASLNRHSLEVTGTRKFEVTQVQRPNSALVSAKTTRGLDRRRPTSALTMLDMKTRKEFI